MTLHTDIGESASAFQNMFAPEPLNPILEPYIYTTKSGITMLNHPLVQSIFHVPAMNGVVNRQYSQKMKILAEVINKRDWDSYVFLHERPYRSRALRGIMHKVPPDQYWPLVRSVWIDTENLWQWGSLKRTLLLAKKPLRDLLMNDAEREMLRGMDEVTPLIFRGFSPPGRSRGWSWTFDRDKAEWFARRYADEGTARVAIGEVDTKDIIAYFEGRNEWEVVVDPITVRVMEVVPV